MHRVGISPWGRTCVSVRGRHYEFAERGREIEGVSAGRTHGSAPTGDGEDGRKLPNAFCHFGAPWLAKRGRDLRQFQRIWLCTVLASHRGGGPVCPLVVGITNSPNVGGTEGVSAGRTHGSAPTGDGEDGRKLTNVFCRFDAPWLVKRGRGLRQCQRIWRCTGLVSHRWGGPVCPPVVDITNSPNAGGEQKVFPLGGHMGPPLRRVVRMGGN